MVVMIACGVMVLVGVVAVVRWGGVRFQPSGDLAEAAEPLSSPPPGDQVAALAGRYSRGLRCHRHSAGRWRPILRYSCSSRPRRRP